MRKKRLQQEADFIPTFKNTWKPVLLILVLVFGMAFASAAVIEDAASYVPGAETQAKAMSESREVLVMRRPSYKTVEAANEKRNTEKQEGMDKGYQWNLHLPEVLRSPNAKVDGHVQLKVDAKKAAGAMGKRIDDSPTPEETSQLQPFAATFDLMRPEIKHHPGEMKPLIKTEARFAVAAV